MSNLHKAIDTLTPMAAAGKKAYGAVTKSAKAFIDAGKGDDYMLCPTGNKAAQSTCSPEVWAEMRGKQLAAYTAKEQEIMALADAKAKLSPAQRVIRDRINGEIRNNFAILRRAIKDLQAKGANAKAAKTGAKAPTAKIDGHDKVLERLTAAIKVAKDCMSENGFKEVHKLAAMIQRQVVADKKIPQ